MYCPKCDSQNISKKSEEIYRYGKKVRAESSYCTDCQYIIHTDYYELTQSTVPNKHGDKSW